MSTAEEKLKKIEQMVAGIEEPGDYEESMMCAADGGNHSDTFESGIEMGEKMLAAEIREVIQND